MGYLDELLTMDSIFQGFFNGITVVHENEQYDGTSNEWVRLSSQGSTAKNISISNNAKVRYKGICYLQIFTRPDIGSARSLAIADEAVNLISNKVINGITFYPSKVVKVGTEDGWYQINVITEFHREG